MFKRRKKIAKIFEGKTCTKCGSTRRMESNKRCYDCANAYIKNSKDKKANYILKNKEVLTSKKKQWREENREYDLAYKVQYRKENKNYFSEKQKESQKENPELWRFYCNKRRTLKLKATPKWANLDKIKDIYLNCPKGQEVDHIVPLKGQNVCGLHVEYNLQYLTKSENRKKRNKFNSHYERMGTAR